MNMTTKEEFEIYVKSFKFNQLSLTLDTDGEYYSLETFKVWMAWNSQQSRIDAIETRALEESNKYVAYCDLAEKQIANLQKHIDVMREALEAVHGTTLVNYTNKTKLKFISKYALEALATVKGE